MAETDAAKVREDDRPLDREHPVERTDREGMLVGPCGRKASLPRRVA